MGHSDREIPADAARVWRGFRSLSTPLEDFFHLLGTAFIPSTVALQAKAGLDTYVPTVVAGLPGKPDTVPDETAILFWDTQQAYVDAFKTLAVRAYHLTHGPVYTPESRGDYPEVFNGQLAVDQPSFLVRTPADWMRGEIKHLIGSRASGETSDAFCAEVAQVVGGLQPGAGIDGAIVCVGPHYLVYWVLGNAADDGTAALASLCEWSHLAMPRPTVLPAGLWDDWPGMTVASGDSFNMQFRRQWE